MTEQLRTVPQLQEELEQLKKDLASAPEVEVAIIEEEIVNVTKLIKEASPVGDELTPNVASAEPTPSSVVATEATTALSAEDQELLNQAREETGEANRGQFLNVTEIQVNNFTEEKEVNGEMVTPRPDKMFMLNTYNKETSTYETVPFAEDFTGIMLKVRFRLESKFGTPRWFRSNEFSDFSLDRVQVKTAKSDNSEVLYDGGYADAKNQLLMKNKKGEMVKAFDLVALVYVKIGDEIYKTKTKIGKDAPLFVYTKSFGENSSFLAFETKFELVWKEVTSTVKFWELQYTQGAPSNLGENLKTLKEINKIFKASEQKVGQPAVAEGEVMQEQTDYPAIDETPIDDYAQPDDDEIKVEDIPF